MDWFNAGTLGASIPLFAMLIPIVAIVGGIVQSIRSEAQRHETIRTLARAGQPIPVELLRRRGQQQDDAVGEVIRGELVRPRPNHSLKTAILLLCIGLSLSIFLFMMLPSSWVWGAGLIPTFLGIGYLVIWWIELRSTTGPTPTGG